MKDQDHYNVLGIERSATGAQVKHAYRQMAHRFHPDVSKDPDGESRFKDVSEAYKTLNRIETRAAYDRLALPKGGIDAAAWNAGSLDAWCAVNPWRDWLWFCAR